MTRALKQLYAVWLLTKVTTVAALATGNITLAAVTLLTSITIAAITADEENH